MAETSAGHTAAEHTALGTHPPQDRQPFQPVGAEPRWRPLYRHLEKLQPGETFYWEEMASILGLDFIEHRSTLAPAFARARRELEAQHKRTCVSQRGLGWKVASPEDHLALARKHQHRAIVEVTRGRKTIEMVDPAELPPELATTFVATGELLKQQGRALERFDVRQSNLDKVLALVAQGTQGPKETVIAQDSDMAELKARLGAVEGVLFSPARLEPETPAIAQQASGPLVGQEG